MDNFKFSVVSDKREVFDLAVKIACLHGGSAKGWRVIPDKGLVFVWVITQSDSTPLPSPLDEQGMSDMAWRWLQCQEYKREPDHDGDNEKGFRIYNEDWGYIGGETYAIFAVEPIWCMYGK